MRPTYSRALEVFRLDLLGRNLAPQTIGLYMATAQRCLLGLNRPLPRLRAGDLRDYVAARSGILSPAAQVGEVSRLRRFFRSLVDADLLPRDPTEGLSVGTPGFPAQRVLSAAQLEALLGAASRAVPWRGLGRAAALRDRALMELLVGLALRASEAAAVMAADLNLAEGTVAVRRAKRGESRVMPLPPAAVPHLKAYLAEGRPALVRRGLDDGGFLLLTNLGTPLRHKQVQRIVARVAERAGVPASPHAIRRAVATGCVRNGASIVAVAEWLGHRRLGAVTGRYVVALHEEVREAVERVRRA